VGADENYGCFFDGQKARLVGASKNRIVAIVPQNFDTAEVEVHIESGGERSESKTLIVGRKIAEDLHSVANPAVDPKDDSIILTRSGSRGQDLPVTLFRLESDGYLQEMLANVLNPTGIAFDPKGQLFVTNRASGEVCRINHDTEVVPLATDLGTATGIAFDSQGQMFVGDRSGTIYQISALGTATAFASLEPSVSAYHLAFDRDDNLLVSAPGLSSYDVIHQIDRYGFNKKPFFKGLGRPQGMALDADGNVYIAACYRAQRGIVKITTAGEAALFVAGTNLVGLCFNRRGEMIVAANDTVYAVPVNLKGRLID
jgi:sugar lactone lactonase YvrE